MFKLLVLLCFLTAQFIITWFGYFLGKVPARGSVFGFSYSSPLILGLCCIMLESIFVAAHKEMTALFS